MKWLTNLFKKTGEAEISEVVEKPKKPKHDLKPGELYILLSNNKENISVSEYLFDDEYHWGTLPIFRCITTKKEHFALCKTMAFTPERLYALSKLEWQEVVILNYNLNDEWNITDAPTKDVYIDPLENFEIIMNAIKAGETK